MFADDTELYFSHSNLLFVKQALLPDIKNVSVWLVANKLKLNVVNSLCMLIGFHQRIDEKCLNLFLNDSTLKQVSVMKYLGVYLISLGTVMLTLSLLRTPYGVLRL